MQRFFVELKKDPNSLDMDETLDDWKKEKPIAFYVNAYHRDQIVDMFGDEYFIIKVVRDETTGTVCE